MGKTFGFAKKYNLKTSISKSESRSECQNQSTENQKLIVPKYYKLNYQNTKNESAKKTIRLKTL